MEWPNTHSLHILRHMVKEASCPVPELEPWEVEGNQMHKVFISYHHRNDQVFKDQLVQMGEENKIFVDRSVDTGYISDSLSDDRIREKIRDEYLKDSTVTIVLVGTETRRRKHVDWEIYSSMFDGTVNKKSGVLVVNLPAVDNGSVWAAHGEREKNIVFPDLNSWQSYSNKVDIESMFPHMPSRITDNLVSGAKISVVGWERLNSLRLSFLVDTTFLDRENCNYDLRAPMKRRNS